MLYRLVISTLFFFCAGTLYAQPVPILQEDSAISNLQQLPSKYLDKVSSKAVSLKDKLDKKSEQAITELQKQEAKITKKLAKVDSLLAKLSNESVGGSD